MSNNRLKILRKVAKKTQRDIANVVNITQNAYSYWETGKVNIDSESLKRLADYYSVSLDFLSGRAFKPTRDVSDWTKEEQEEYYTSDDNKKIYLEYLWGAPVFLDDSQTEANDGKILAGVGITELPANNAFLSEHELLVLEAYRTQPKMQAAVDRILGVPSDTFYEAYEAASSSDHHAPRIIRKPKEEWDIIVNAPDTDDPLL